MYLYPIFLGAIILIYWNFNKYLIASSPFIVQQHYGFSPFAFSICFAVNAVAIGVAATISVKFRQLETGTLTGCIGMLCLSVCVMIALYNGCGFWTYELLMFALLFTMGLTFTSSTTLAMIAEAVKPEHHPPIRDHNDFRTEGLFLRWSAWEISLYLPELHLWSAPSVPCFVHYGRWGKYRWK